MFNVNSLYNVMWAAINRNNGSRRSTCPDSPNQETTAEAMPGLTFSLIDCTCNLLTSAPVDFRWTLANVLHFFAATEEAAMLRKYNKHADRYLTGNTWIGAYGAKAMPQVLDCVQHLLHYPESRRAIVTMGGMYPMDVNRPACWNLLHFLRSNNALDLLVYQRSLAMEVMPYDIVVLSNVLQYVAYASKIPCGVLRWTIGSLHARRAMPQLTPTSPACCNLPFDVMDSPSACIEALLCEDRFLALAAVAGADREVKL